MREVGRSIARGRLALCGTCMISASASLEFSLPAVHELDVPAHAKGKKKSIRQPGLKRNSQFLIMFDIFVPLKGNKNNKSLWLEFQGTLAFLFQLADRKGWIRQPGPEVLLKVGSWTVVSLYPKWIVYNGKPIKIDDLGVPPILGNLHMGVLGIHILGILIQQFSSYLTISNRRREPFVVAIKLLWCCVRSECAKCHVH